MPTKLFTFTNVSPNQMWYPDQSRVCVTIHVQSNETDGCEIYDAVPESTNNNFIVRIYPGDTLFLSAIEGHDVTKSYFIRKINAGSMSVRIQEEFLDPSLMALLEQKGITTTQGLPFLLLALLAGSQ